MGFSRQGYWSGLPFPSPGDLPDLGIKLSSPTWQEDSLPNKPPTRGALGWGGGASCNRFIGDVARCKESLFPIWGVYHWWWNFQFPNIWRASKINREYRHTSIYCALQVIVFLQVEALWQPHLGQVYWCHFLTVIAHLVICVILHNSCNISNF